jgi:hypothetical protein
MSTVGYIGNVGKNFLITAGCGLAANLLTAVISKTLHNLLNVNEDARHGSTMFIRQVAAAATLTGCYHLSPSLPLSKLPADRFFLYVHAAFIALGFQWANRNYCVRPLWPVKVHCLNLAASCLATPFVSHYGNNALPVIYGIGTAAGSFL